MAAGHPILAGLFGTAVETALTRYLALDPRSDELLQPLAGKVVAVRLKPFGSTVYVCPGQTGVQVLTEISGEPDAVLVGYLGTFAKLGLSSPPDRSLVSGEIEIEGDAEIAGDLRRLLGSLRVDWQDHLSRLASPEVAAGLFAVVRSGAAWGRGTVEALRQDLGEYWQEETRELPARPEVDLFAAEIDRLLNDCARLEARVQRLSAGGGLPPRGTPAGSHGAGQSDPW